MAVTLTKIKTHFDGRQTSVAYVMLIRSGSENRS
jgi:hypothetical protein